MKMNDSIWLLQKGGYDDCGITSVGGAAFALTEEAVAIPDVKQFPVKEMIKRGWITCENTVFSEFFDVVGGWDRLCPLYRRTEIRSDKESDPYALAAWTTRLVMRSLQEQPKGRFRVGSVNLQLMTEIAKLSTSSAGAHEAKTRLSQLGISLIVEPHLPRTYLDGAALRVTEDLAIIGLTVRYDRVDNFWYCLLHELAHLALHVDRDKEIQFFDDLDKCEGIDPREKEADTLAGEALIPELEWEASPAKLLPSKEAAELLASELKIHPAIVAGRMRFERSYVFLSELVGAGKVRMQFPDINWS
jgi:HTH-type transcriptional regulator / antitoxin HigA